jgi:predicted site-specific integrase-resolvase
VKLVSTGEVARLYGVSPQTIRRWINNDEFEKVEKTKGGQYRVGIEQHQLRIGYARVSSSKQKSSLKEQTRQLLAFDKQLTIVTDVGSGFNFRRKGFVSLLEQAVRGIAIHVVVCDRDRLTRSGFDLVELVLRSCGGQVTTLHQAESGDEFRSQQLISFITSFCNSYYGRRSARNKVRLAKDQDLSAK